MDVSITNLPGELILNICHQLCEPHDIVASVRNLAGLGCTCRYLYPRCLSSQSLSLLLGKKSSRNPTIPFEAQLQLAAQCHQLLTKWVIYLPPLYDKQALSQLIDRIKPYCSQLKTLVFYSSQTFKHMPLYQACRKEASSFPKLEILGITEPQKHIAIPFQEAPDDLYPFSTAPKEMLTNEETSFRSTGSLFLDYNPRTPLKELTNLTPPKRITGVTIAFSTANLNELDAVKEWQGWQQVKQVTIHIQSRCGAESATALFESIYAPQVTSLYIKAHGLKRSEAVSRCLKAIPKAFPNLKRHHIRIKGKQVQRALQLFFSGSQVKELRLNSSQLGSLADCKHQLKQVRVLHLKLVSKEKAPVQELWELIRIVAPHVVQVIFYPKETMGMQGPRDVSCYPLTLPVSLPALRVIDLSLCKNRVDGTLQALQESCSALHNLQVILPG